MKEQASRPSRFCEGRGAILSACGHRFRRSYIKIRREETVFTYPPPAFPFRSAPAHFCFPCESYSRESTHANQRVFITFSTKRKNRAPPTDERDRSLRFV